MINMTQAELRTIKARLAEMGKRKSANSKEGADIIIIARALEVLIQDYIC